MTRKPKPNKKKYVKGKVLRVSARVQEHYTTAIKAAIAHMGKDAKAQYKELFEKEFATQHFAAVKPGVHVGTTDAESFGSQTRILTNALKRKYDQLFGSLALGLSPWMADETNRTSANQVRGSVDELPNLKEEGAKLSLDIRKLDDRTKAILQTSAAQSADFIKSIPERYLNDVSGAVYDSIVTGNGLQDLEPFFEKQDSKVQNWAHNTAMDQTRKAFNGLNLGRMNKLGITKGEWIHSGGSQHPRELHEDFDGEQFDLNVGAPVGDDGGNNVLPGEEPNCRCTFAPVIPYEDDDSDEGDDSESDGDNDAEAE